VNINPRKPRNNKKNEISARILILAFILLYVILVVVTGK
jgi:hypothetical protein